MKKLILLVFGLVCLALISGWLFFFISKPQFVSPLKSLNNGQIDYTPYAFENLQTRRYFKSEIKLEKVLEENESFTSYFFSFSSEGRRITGMANLPQKEGPLPVVILLRGWVDEEIYQTGLGTKKMADFLAREGFITLAPDFLGYGGSDPAFADMLLTRFFRPITVISLLDSLESLPQADSNRVVMWGHSNGGQIALSVLEITGRDIPTSLWAPVSAAFPESILYFANEMEDGGEMLRKMMAEFEKNYDPSEFSPSSYYRQIKAPLILHQGLKDESVPPAWNDQLAQELKDLGKEITYYRYSDEDHNFTHGSAPAARERDLKFFQEKLGLN
jgi:dipeptidyl aminopeptidase/acylaminoacyl peptidase